MRKWFRLMALALALASMFVMSSGALAAAKKTITITNADGTKTVTTIGGEETAANESGLVKEAKGEITASGVNFRKGPGTNYSRISRLAKGTAVTVIDNTTNAGWWKIKLADGTEGYVSADYVRIAGTSSLDLPAASGEEKESASASPSYQVSGKDPNASKIAAAKKKNSDTIGWIQVPNTNIDYPILYAPNFYYADHDINKRKSNDGVYPYYNRLTKNIALFGHNLRGSGTGFHQLHHMQETSAGHSRCQSSSCGKSLGSTHKNWARDNRIWNISIFGKSKWEVFSMYEVTGSEPISTLRNNWNPLSGQSQSTIQKWINTQLSRSEINFGVSVSPSDTFLTIITCATNYKANTNARLFVVLKCVG